MCHWDHWNVGKHALQRDHNWAKVFGSKTPTLADIKLHLGKVLKNGTWTKVGDAHGPGGILIGEVLEADANVGGHTLWVRGFRRVSDGKILVTNGGVR